jgi:hypothetical protein
LGVGGEFGFGEVFWVWGGRVSEGWGKGEGKGDGVDEKSEETNEGKKRLN